MRKVEDPFPSEAGKVTESADASVVTVPQERYSLLQADNCVGVDPAFSATAAPQLPIPMRSKSPTPREEPLNESVSYRSGRENIRCPSSWAMMPIVARWSPCRSPNWAYCWIILPSTTGYPTDHMLHRCPQIDGELPELYDCSYPATMTIMESSVGSMRPSPLTSY